eukprot:8754-Amphidinium_carterae.1
MISKQRCVARIVQALTNTQRRMVMGTDQQHFPKAVLQSLYAENHFGKMGKGAQRQHHLSLNLRQRSACLGPRGKHVQAMLDFAADASHDLRKTLGKMSSGRLYSPRQE